MVRYAEKNDLLRKTHYSYRLAQYLYPFYTFHIFWRLGLYSISLGHPFTFLFFSRPHLFSLSLIHIHFCFPIYFTPGFLSLSPITSSNKPFTIQLPSFLFPYFVSLSPIFSVLFMISSHSLLMFCFSFQVITISFALSFLPLQLSYQFFTFLFLNLCFFLYDLMLLFFEVFTHHIFFPISVSHHPFVLLASPLFSS